MDRRLYYIKAMRKALIQKVSPLWIMDDFSNAHLRPFNAHLRPFIFGRELYYSALQSIYTEVHITMIRQYWQHNK